MALFLTGIKVEEKGCMYYHACMPLHEKKWQCIS